MWLSPGRIRIIGYQDVSLPRPAHSANLSVTAPVTSCGAAKPGNVRRIRPRRSCRVGIYLHDRLPPLRLAAVAVHSQWLDRDGGAPFIAIPGHTHPSCHARCRLPSRWRAAAVAVPRLPARAAGHEAGQLGPAFHGRRSRPLQNVVVNRRRVRKVVGLTGP